MIFSLIICISILLLSIAKFKFNSLISLLGATVLFGITSGLPLEQIPATIYKGFGDQVKSLALLITFGAILGRLLNESGASSQIAETLLNFFGAKNVQVAVLSVALLIGITMFFEAAFIVLIPIIYSLSQKMNRSLIYIGLPGVIGLSITHSFLPPHPGPAAVCTLYEADIGLTLIFGLILVLPCAFLTGIFYSRSRWANSVNPPLPKEFLPQETDSKKKPPFLTGLFCIILPVILIAAPTILKFVSLEVPAINFFGSPPLAMLVGVFFAMYFLGIRRGMSLSQINALINQAAQSVAMIILTIGAGGAFKQIIVDTGLGNYIAARMLELDLSPLISAWALAALIRFAVGSATVAITIAAGIMLSVVQNANIQPEIMVLATSTGSIFASHVNDPGFWLFKEYFNLSLTDALKIRTTYTCILSVLGLAGVILINFASS
mgnify:CR=1 FL=1